MALTSIEQVRLIIGDTISPFILTDEEIQYFLDKYEGNVNRASIDSARCVYVEILRYPTKEVAGDIEVSSQWASEYRKWLEMFLKDPNVSPFNPIAYAGGISKSDMLNNDSNNDNVIQDIYDGFKNGVKVYNKDNCTTNESDTFVFNYGN